MYSCTITRVKWVKTSFPMKTDLYNLLTFQGKTISYWRNSITWVPKNRVFIEGGPWVKLDERHSLVKYNW